MAVVLVGAAGCGDLDARRAGASTAARAFERAWQARDASGVCGLLAAGTLEELEKQAQLPCPRAVLDEELDPSGPVDRVDVHGRQARVVLAKDTLFLTREAGEPGEPGEGEPGEDAGAGWRVVAAGCAPRPGQPYDCVLQGG
ncbi:hypothetical protein [Streptomyces sp. Da 82-17]|uniref:hypothetical protein n=1 Tax=Streptomyces sp. Da 82-17 TaxID=3377116 RepID=UPI0038D493FA